MAVRKSGNLASGLAAIATGLAACLLLSVNSTAQCPGQPTSGIVANPNRPTVADPADITQYGVLEVEYGYYRVMGPQRERGNNLVGLFKFALLCNLEIRWDTDTLLRQTVNGVTQTGFGDNALGFEYRFHHQSKFVPALSIGYSLTFPSASVAKGLGTGKYDHEIRLYVSKDILGTHFDYNAAYIFMGRTVGGGTDQFSQMNLAFSHPIYKKLQFTGEFYGNLFFNNSAPAFVDGLWAFTYAIKPRLVVDSGIDHALTAGAPFRRGYFVGVTYSIADIYKAMGRHP